MTPVCRPVSSTSSPGSAPRRAPRSQLTTASTRCVHVARTVTFPAIPHCSGAQSHGCGQRLLFYTRGRAAGVAGGVHGQRGDGPGGDGDGGARPATRWIGVGWQEPAGSVLRRRHRVCRGVGHVRRLLDQRPGPQHDPLRRELFLGTMCDHIPRRRPRLSCGAGAGGCGAQICSATSRLLLHEAIAPAFLVRHPHAALSRFMASMRDLACFLQPLPPPLIPPPSLTPRLRRGSRRRRRPSCARTPCAARAAWARW